MVVEQNLLVVAVFMVLVDVRIQKETSNQFSPFLVKRSFSSVMGDERSSCRFSQSRK